MHASTPHKMMNYNHQHHLPGPTQHNASITVTCVRAHKFLTNPYASCSDCCILLLHPLPTCTDAGPNLCTFCPNLGTLHPDLCTLCLWCHLSINQCKYSTCTHGGDHWMAYASGKYSLHRWWCHPVQLVLVVIFLSPTGTHTLLALERLALCSGGSCMWMWRWCL